jgi:hypothetical protein
MPVFTRSRFMTWALAFCGSTVDKLKSSKAEAISVCLRILAPLRFKGDVDAALLV